MRKKQIVCFFLGCLLESAFSLAIAQNVGDLPASPEYKGEIRRGPDGKLTVQSPEHEAAVQGVEQREPRVLVVGEGEKVSTISDAARLARDGDVVEIRSGEYRGQPAVWTQNKLTIRGTGKRPVMLADGRNAEGKAIWVIRGGDIRIENIEFRGARVPVGNGAGIRFERGHLTVDRCAFFDNEMGILTANFPELALDVLNSEFGAAPQHAGQLHHLLYVGSIGRFSVQGSRFEQGYLGHLLKSRARENDVRYNFLVDGEGGRASYELEFPNGGLAYVIGNVIEQAAGTDNPVLVSYGAEGPRWQDNALYFAHNTMVNDFHAGTFLKIWNEKFPDGIEAWVINNLTVGDGDLFRPAQGRFEGNMTAQRRDLLVYGGIPSRPNNGSPLRGAVRIPGAARGVDLLPDAEFMFPAGVHPIRRGNAITPGAFQ